MAQSRLHQDLTAAQRRSVHFVKRTTIMDNIPEHNTAQQQYPNQLPPSRQPRPSTRRKLQKAPRQRHIRPSPPHALRTLPLSRSASTLSGDSRGHLLPSDAHNRSTRYPPRSSSSQRGVLRKRRNDAAAQRSYHAFSTRPRTGEQQHPFPSVAEEDDRPVPRAVPEEHTRSTPNPDPISEHGAIVAQNTTANNVVQVSRQHSIGPTPVATQTSWARRRWSTADHLQSSSSAPPHESPTAINASTGKEKALPALPAPILSPAQVPRAPHTPTQHNAVPRSMRRNSNLPSLPLYTPSPDTNTNANIDLNRNANANINTNTITAIPSPIPQSVADTAYQKRLCTDFLTGERTYVDTLRRCVKSEETSTSNSNANATSLALLLALLSLIQVSDDLIVSMELNPSPMGVASAFLGICIPLENGLVKWAEELRQLSLDHDTMNVSGGMRGSANNKALPPTPTVDSDVDEYGYNNNNNNTHHDSTNRRTSLLKRVSILWGGSSSRDNRRRNSATASTLLGSSSSSPGGLGNHIMKPDRIWQKRGDASTTGPGLWEMSVLPVQRVTQYRYLLRELLSTLPASHEAYKEVERALHVATFIGEKVARMQERVPEA